MFALFDLDDTVHDKKASLKACASHMYKTYLIDFEIAYDDFSHLFIQQNCIIQNKTDAFNTIAQALKISDDVKTTMLEFFDHHFHTYAQRFDYVLEAMNYLKAQNITMACVTNGRDFFQRNKIQALGLDEFFEVIVTSGELGVKKPDPLIFNIALQQLGAKATDCVFIGDSLKADLAPAKMLGMQTLWVTNLKVGHPDIVDANLASYFDFKEKWEQLTTINLSPRLPKK